MLSAKLEATQPRQALCRCKSAERGGDTRAWPLPALAGASMAATLARSFAELECPDPTSVLRRENPEPQRLQAQRVQGSVLGVPIDVTDWDQALEKIGSWAAARESRVVCACNVHSVVSAQSDARLMHALREADLNVADGMPVAWMLRKLGFAGQARLAGPELMWRLCQLAEHEGLGVFLHGSTVPTSEALQARLRQAFPGLKLLGCHVPASISLDAADGEDPSSPPESDPGVRAIQDSGAQLIFVALGCPKQERWMMRRRASVPGVMLGVGAAFDFHAGRIARAPRWMQDRGLEWLHRMASEPGRLWQRYLLCNTRFVLGASLQLARDRSTARNRFHNASRTLRRDSDESGLS